MSIAPDAWGPRFWNVTLIKNGEQNIAMALTVQSQKTVEVEFKRIQAERDKHYPGCEIISIEVSFLDRT